MRTAGPVETSTEEADANARLLAASPTLLAALGVALGLITKHGLAVSMAELHPKDFERLQKARELNEELRR